MADSAGLIILGNARVGKSFLVNTLAGTTFEHKRSATAVTVELQQTEVPINEGKNKLIIFNLPGLIDLDSKDTMERNKGATREAFIRCPNSIIGFVFKDKNGSVALEDVGAFNAVNRSYTLQEQSLLFIVNQWEVPDPQNEAALVLKLRKLTEKPHVRVVFVPSIKEGDQAEKDRVQRELFSLLSELQSTTHTESSEHPLDLNENAQQLQELTNKLSTLDQQLKDKDAAIEKERVDTKNQLDAQKQAQIALEEQLKQAQDAIKKQGSGGGGLFSKVGKVLDKVFRF